MTDRRPDIDGLRAIAVLSVLLFHAGYPAFTGGFVGVDVFFVISGYLITGIILKDQSATLIAHLRDFYVRRVRRIFPALLAVLAASLAAGWFLLLPADYEALARQALAGALFVPNILFWSEAGYFDKAAELKPLLHLWSLGIEEQFYLLWPLAIFFVKRTRALRLFLIAVTAASFALCVYLTTTNPVSAFYLPFSRVWELSLGGLLAAFDWRSGNQRINALAALAGLLAICIPVVTFQPGPHFPGAIAAIPVLGTALLIWSGDNTPLAKRLLSLRPVVYIGLISYPLYLWHWPLISLIRQNGWSIPRSGVLIFSIVLAVLTYELIEKRIRHARTPAVSLSLLSAMAASAMAALLVIASQGAISRYPADVASILKTMNYDYGSDARLYKCWLVDEKGPKQFASSCTEPRAPGGILIVGDSHAARLYPGLVRTLDTPTWQVTTSSCLPLGGSPLCNYTRDYAIDVASKQHPRIVILFAAWVNYSSDWSSETQFAKLLGGTIDRFSKTGSRVIVLGPAPIWNPSLPAVAFRRWQDTRSIPAYYPLRDDRVSRVDGQIREISQRHGATFISVHNLLCSEDGCAVHVPNKPGDLISWDYGHLTTAGATYLATLILSPTTKAALRP